MTDGIARFLAVNCVLNGHSLLDAFDGDTAVAASALDMTTEEVARVDSSLSALETKGDEGWCADPIIRTVLNLIRTREYAFLQTPQGPIYYQEFVESDRLGQVRDDVREAVLSTLITDIQYVNMRIPELETRYFDGLLLLQPGISNDELKDKILTAYKLYRDGPGTGKEHLLKQRHKLSVGNAEVLPASKVKSILVQLAKGKVPPSAYAKSTLMVTDLLTTYRATGILCEYSTAKPGYIDFLMHCDEDNADVTVTLSMEAVNTVVRSGIKNLGRTRCVPGATRRRDEYRMEYGGRLVASEV